MLSTGEMTFVYLVGDSTHCMMGWVKGTHEPDVCQRLKDMFRTRYKREAGVVELSRPDIAKQDIDVIYVGGHD